MVFRIEKFCATALTVIFLGTIFSPGLCQLAGVDLPAEPSGEKRELRDFPELAWTGKTLRNFPRDFGNWFQDHFGLRRLMIRANSLVTYFVLHTSPQEKVILGRDGWLFFNGKAAGDGDPVSDGRGINPLSPLALERWRITLQDLHDWFAERHIPFLVAVEPGKESMYPEFLPAHMTRVGPETTIEQVSRYFESRAAFPCVDLLTPLRQARREMLAYYRTDTHWNQFGAYRAYRALADRLAVDFPAIQPEPEFAFARVEEPRIGGDLASMIDLRNSLPDIDVKMVPATPRRARFMRSDDSEVAVNCSEVDDATLPRALVFRDSFFVSLLPYLAEHFRFGYYQWLVNGVDEKTIAAADPEVVLFIIGDRHLRNVCEYPPAIRDWAAARRFDASTNILLSAQDALRKCKFRGLDGTEISWVDGRLVARNDQRIPLLEFTFPPAAAAELPIARFELTLNHAGSVALAWTNPRDGRRYRDRVRAGGRRQAVDLYLLDPEAEGPLTLSLGDRPGACQLDGVEIRSVDR